MRATAITMSIIGPLLTFFLGAVVTAINTLGSPSAITTPQAYLAIALGAAPGVALSLIAVVAALRSASAAQRSAWRVVLALWAILIVAATAYVAIALNSSDFPWFFPLIALPLASLVYYIIHTS